MVLNPMVSAIALLVTCFILGALPLVGWITRSLTGKQLREIGTGNISVSAAFYHGGQGVGILAVLSEAFKGIAAVLLAQWLFPTTPAWCIIALIALVLGRFSLGKGAGTTNVVWGFVAYDWRIALLVFVLGGIGFTLLREKRTGRIGVLVLVVVITALLHPQQPGVVVATMFLCTLIGWIYSQVPDDLDLPTQTAQSESRQMFQFFRGDRALKSLDQALDPEQAGTKAATLSLLRREGYPVPMGWVLPAGDDMTPLLEMLKPSPKHPVVVRSSATGEDTEFSSAAGLYESFLNIQSTLALENAIAQCQLSYTSARAQQYRRDRGIPDGAIAVLVQEQVQGAFSGVAFSRDPIVRSGDAVVIEALPGTATQVVSGRVTPEQYRIYVADAAMAGDRSDWRLPNGITLPMEGEGDVPPYLIQQVAYLARHLEQRFHGIPQDIEWSYDGQQLWLLQARPITTLLPLWTRKIAAEVIPGFIRPLTWSINRPLTCGVWGQLFTIVLGDRADGLDFTETATLHYSAAYFNATLLGDLFRRMGLPAESLDFLTRGAKFSKPPLRSTLQNIPGLLRLVGREFTLEKDFATSDRQYFAPGIQALRSEDLSTLPDPALLNRIDTILDLLERATYYSILAPISASLRQAVLRVDAAQLDNQATPEVAVVRSLQALADRTRPLVESSTSASTLFEQLQQTPEGQAILEEFDRILDTYGYLSEVGTDIAVPTWREAPEPVQAMFTQFVLNPPPASSRSPRRLGWTGRQAQRRLNLKGRVTEVYSYLLAALRWTFIELERRWLEAGHLTSKGDLFFLEIDELRQMLLAPNETNWDAVTARLDDRRSHFNLNRKLLPPAMVYGNDPPELTQPFSAPTTTHQQLTGIGASPGQMEGIVQVVTQFNADLSISKETILVVPYTDSGWAPLLVRAGGIVADVGGQLSHGAIVAREYGIPAVMNVHNATQILNTGQRIRLDGQRGTVEIL